jgi:hypothetical protein
MDAHLKIIDTVGRKFVLFAVAVSGVLKQLFHKPQVVHRRLVVRRAGVGVRNRRFQVDNVFGNRRIAAFKFDKSPLPLGVVPVRILQKVQSQPHFSN